MSTTNQQNAQQNTNTDLIRQFVTIALQSIPAAAPFTGVILEAYDRWAARSGDNADPAEFKAMLDSRQWMTDRLDDPDSFRTVSKPTIINQPPQPIPPPPLNPGAITQPQYGTLMSGAIADDDELLAIGYRVGDKVCVAGAAWMMIKKGQSTLGATVLRTVGDSE